MFRLFIVPCVLCILCAAINPAGAHELQSNRATLVLRDGNHLSLTLFIRPGELLHRVMAPTTPQDRFFAECAAMSAADFQKLAADAKARLAAGTRVVAGTSGNLPARAWVLPEAAKIQSAVQQLAMHHIVSPGVHAHEDIMEIRAEFESAAAVDAVTLKLPPALGDVLVVSYRPQQRLLQPGKPAPAIRFPRS